MSIGNKVGISVDSDDSVLVGSSDCGLLLPQSSFMCGQLYVGLSWCRDQKNFFVYENQEEFWALNFDLDPNLTYTRNFACKEVFND